MSSSREEVGVKIGRAPGRGGERSVECVRTVGKREVYHVSCAWESC